MSRLNFFLHFKKRSDIEILKFFSLTVNLDKYLSCQRSGKFLTVEGDGNSFHDNPCKYTSVSVNLFE